LPWLWDRASNPRVVEESFVLSAISSVGIGGRRETVSVPNILDVQVQTLYRICQSTVDRWYWWALTGSTRDRLRRRNRVQGRCQYVELHSVALHSIELRDVELHRPLPWNRGDPDALRGAVVREEGGGEESMDSNHADGSLICLRKGRAK
jgi:hypothetical protein